MQTKTVSEKSLPKQLLLKAARKRLVKIKSRFLRAKSESSVTPEARISQSPSEPCARARDQILVVNSNEQKWVSSIS